MPFFRRYVLVFKNPYNYRLLKLPCVLVHFWAFFTRFGVSGFVGNPIGLCAASRMLGSVATPVWCGVVRCGAVWCGVVRCGAIVTDASAIHHGPSENP